MNDHRHPGVERHSWQLTENEFDNFDLVAERIDRFGFVVLPAYFSADTVDSLSKEFEQLLKLPQTQLTQPLEMKHGRGTIVSFNCRDIAGFPATKRAFSSPIQTELAKRYWNRSIKLNSEIYCMHEVVGTEHVAQDLHFDVTETFKSFVYLNDISAENGAFFCIPGSHKEVRAYRRDHAAEISYENRGATRFEARDKQAIPVEGPAGTMIFFTTEVLHKAGKASVGQRMIMRGHTRARRSVIDRLLGRRR